MKRFSQYVNEVIIGGWPNYKNRPLVDGGGSTETSSGPTLKDLTGVNMPPDDIIAAGIAGTGGQKLNAMGLQRYQKPSLAARTTKTVKDTAYDIVNKPHPFNPLTAKDIGNETGTARYHAEKKFTKETGREPPKFTDTNNKAVDQTQLKKDIGRVSDLESDFAKRGYQPGVGRSLGHVEIGSNVNSPVKTTIPKPNPMTDVKKVANKTSLDAARLGAVQALDLTRDKREKRINDN